jgi:thioredoxin 1
MGGKMKVAKLNVDENQELAMQFRVSSIPAFVLFKNGQAVDRTVGAMPKSAFKTFLSSHVA